VLVLEPGLPGAAGRAERAGELRDAAGVACPDVAGRRARWQIKAAR
jgi:hypothetical protein